MSYSAANDRSRAPYAVEEVCVRDRLGDRFEVPGVDLDLFV